MATDKGNSFLLFDGQTTNATSDGVALTKANGNFVTCTGGFGGGTLTLEVLSNGAWAPIDGGEFTEAGSRFMASGAGSRQIRGVLTGATAATLTVEVSK